MGCDIISRENVNVIYLSNALNFKDENVVKFESSGYDRTISGNIVRNSYDMLSYYASQFMKQMKFLEEMKLLEEYETNKGIKLGEKFTIKFPKVVDVRIPKCTQINLNMDFRALNGYETLKQFNTTIIKEIASQHYETQFLIMLILSLEKMLWEVIILSKNENEIDKFKIEVTEYKKIFDSQCKDLKLNEKFRKDYLEIFWKRIISELKIKFSKPHYEKKFEKIEAYEELYNRIKKMGFYSNSISRIDIEEIAGENGLYNLYTKIQSNISCLCFDWPLSSGEKAILDLLSNLMEVCKKQGINKNYFIVIDELDLYLHPTLQQDIISILQEYICVMLQECSIQVLFTTHSPLVLSDIPREKTIFLRKEIEGVVVVEDIGEYKTFGANITSLYYNSFFMEHGSMGSYARKKISEIISRLRNEKEKITDEEYKGINAEIQCIGDSLI